MKKMKKLLNGNVMIDINKPSLNDDNITSKETKTEGGIIIPKSEPETKKVSITNPVRQHGKPVDPKVMTGKVIESGDGRKYKYMNKHGDTKPKCVTSPVDVNIGDEVMFEDFTTEEIVNSKTGQIEKITHQITEISPGVYIVPEECILGMN